LQSSRVNILLLLFGAGLKESAIHIKKTFTHPKRDDEARNEFIKKLKSIDQENLVYLDESGIEDNACPINGWSVKGSRCYDKKVYQHKRRVSMIAGLCNKKIIAPLIFEGTCDSAVFEAYVKDFLIKELKPEQVVVMDNINFHKRKEIERLIKSVGASILFLPTYSPDLNPIENHWFRIKHYIRKIAAKFIDFFDAVAYALSLPL
jgi:transposase